MIGLWLVDRVAGAIEGGPEFAKERLQSPGPLEVCLYLIHDWAVKFNHHVVPVITVLTSDVHSAEVCDAVIDQDGFGVITGQPGIEYGANFDI